MLSNQQELIDKINRYLTHQFIGFEGLVPLDECEHEARRILGIVDEWLEENVTNINVPSETILEKE